MNKDTDAWWAEVEESASGIQKQIEACLLWWPTAKNNDEVGGLMHTIAVLKNFHAQDYY